MNSKLIFPVFFLIIFAYVIIRAILLGITYDEAWTLHTFVPLSVSNIFLFKPCDANNQILNTILIKVFFIFGNHSLFMARLPNVLAFVVYAYSIYKISTSFLHRFIGITLFIILLCNPFVLDFFSLARGYGLALSFQMCALYNLLQYQKNNNLTRFALSIGSGILAVLSNFTFLYFFLALLFAGHYMYLVRFRINLNYVKILGISIMLTLILAVVIYTPISELIKNDGLYYGGITGFYQDTLLTLFSFSIYHPYDIPTATLVLNLFLTFFIIMVLLFFINHRRSKQELLSVKAIIVLIILCIATLSIELNHYFTGSLYLTDRTVLLFFPLLIMVMMFFADGITHRFFRIPIKIITIVIGIFSMVNVSINANFIKTISWPFDAYSEKILNQLNEIGIKENKIKTLDFSWPFESSLTYYFSKNNYSHLVKAKNTDDRDKLNQKTDYYIYYNRGLDKVFYFIEKQPIINIKKDTLLRFPDEDIYVFSNYQTQITR